MICSAMRVISTIDRNTSQALAVIARMMKTTLFVLLHTCFRAWLASRLYRVAIRRPTVIPPYEGVWTPRTSEGFAHVGMVSGRPGQGEANRIDPPARGWQIA